MAILVVRVARGCRLEEPEEPGELEELEEWDEREAPALELARRALAPLLNMRWRARPDGDFAAFAGTALNPPLRRVCALDKVTRCGLLVLPALGRGRAIGGALEELICRECHGPRLCCCCRVDRKLSCQCSRRRRMLLLLLVHRAPST